MARRRRTPMFKQDQKAKEKKNENRKQQKNFALVRVTAKQPKSHPGSNQKQSGQRCLYRERSGKIKPGAVIIDLSEKIGGSVKIFERIEEAKHPGLRQDKIIRVKNY